MNDKELIQKLKCLREIRPDNSWKKETRDVLLAQISNSAAKEIKVYAWEKAVNDCKNLLSFVPRAAWGAICLAIILSGGGFGVYAANYSRPGDSLYAARILKEKARLALTFNQENKAKLGMKLASVRAREITEVLADPDYRGDEKQAEKLAQNFQKEINTVKERFSEIGKIQEKNSAGRSGGLAAIGANDSDGKVGIGDLKKDSDAQVFGADYGKDANGVQIYVPSSSRITAVDNGKILTATSAEKFLVATSSGAASAAASASSTNMSEKINFTLDKAAESFNTKDFTGAKEMLLEADVIIEKIDSGAAKAVNEAGTSTAGGGGSVGIVGSSSGIK
jgi:hypothetical protein